MERVLVRRAPGETVVELKHPHSPAWAVGSWVVTVLGVGAFVGIIGLAGAGGNVLGLPLFGLGMVPMIFLPYAIFLGPWLSTGREVVTVGGGQLTIRMVALGIPWSTRRFDLAHVRDVRFAPLPNLNRALMHTLVLDPGSLAFDYGHRTVRFGRWLNTAEAAPAIEALTEALSAPGTETVGVVTGAATGPARPVPPARQRISDAKGALVVRMPFGNTPTNRRALGVSMGGLLIVMVAMSVSLGALFQRSTGSWAGALASVLVLVIAVPILGISLMSAETARLTADMLELGTSQVLLTMVGKRRFDVRYIHNLRYEPVPIVDNDLATIWSKYFKGEHGLIAFGYGAEQHRFGQYLDAPEAREVADALNEALRRNPAAGTLAWEAYQAGMRKG